MRIDPPPPRTGQKTAAHRGTFRVKKMHPSRGVARPGRGGDVDLEALQESFLRSAEKPSAKVTRSKVRVASTLNQI